MANALSNNSLQIIHQLIHKTLAQQHKAGTIFGQQLVEISSQWLELDAEQTNINLLPELTCKAVEGDISRAVPVVAAWQLVRLAAKFLDDVEDNELTNQIAVTINTAVGFLNLAQILLWELLQQDISAVVDEMDRLTICGNVKFDLEKGHHILLDGQMATFLERVGRPVTSGQLLLGLSYQLALNHKQNETSHAGNGQQAAPTTAINDVRQEILSLVAKLRHFAGDLRPAGLDELGLSAAIEGYVTRLQREEEQEIPLIELSLESTKENMPESVAICLFRVTQEGLRNALRHAGATHIQLNLSIGPENAYLKICDNGQGFSVPTRLSQLAWYNHFGLVGMSEQVNSVGGHFTIRSQPNLGTEIWVQVPLFNKENAHEQSDSSIACR